MRAVKTFTMPLLGLLLAFGFGSCSQLTNLVLLPIADAGLDRDVPLGIAVSLNGGASQHADSYSWTLGSSPLTSSLSDADIKNSTREIASFTPDVDGLYIFTLKVTNGAGSDTSNVKITAITAGSGQSGTLAIPAGFAKYASSETSSGVSLHWNAVAEAAGYYVCYQTYFPADQNDYLDYFTVSGTTILASDMEGYLNPSTTYYFFVQSFDESGWSDMSSVVQATTLAAPVITPLSASPDSWIDGAFSSVVQTLWYEVTVPSSATNYDIYWDDSYDGSGTTTCDVKVSAYKADMTTPYFIREDSGYNLPQAVAKPGTETIIYVKVEPYYSGDQGSFRLKVQTN